MAKNDDQPRPESLRRELHAADLGRRNDVSGDTDDEQITNALVENNLGWHARIRAPENDGEGFLACDYLASTGLSREGFAGSSASCEASISFYQAFECFER